MLSQTEENYLKALFHITHEIEEKQDAGTNELAAYLEVTPATVNDMLKKLKEKQLVMYEKYGKITLTRSGKEFAIEVIRKHRLWETFLFEKLKFSWDEIHEVAEQLEHIKSKKLVEQLDWFLEYPEVDPHGDPIPNTKAEIKLMKRRTLNQVPAHEVCTLIGVKDNSAPFLQHAMKIGLGLHCKIKILKHYEFDGSVEIEVNQNRSTISQKFAENLFVQ
ncbi:MAG: metal-dependent transcriptional regulator [Bacteroidia bacterium]|nr:metal-dependent transcriptional regulator [Bacteroidia bacterium]